MTTLNLTPQQIAAAWEALEDRVDTLKADHLSTAAIGEELKALLEVLEIFETLHPDFLPRFEGECAAFECFEGKRLR